jgi:hypothetical protein
MPEVVAVAAVLRSQKPWLTSAGALCISLASEIHWIHVPRVMERLEDERSWSMVG